MKINTLEQLGMYTMEKAREKYCAFPLDGTMCTGTDCMAFIWVADIGDENNTNTQPYHCCAHVHKRKTLIKRFKKLGDEYGNTPSEISYKDSVGSEMKGPKWEKTGSGSKLDPHSHTVAIGGNKLGIHRCIPQNDVWCASMEGVFDNKHPLEAENLKDAKHEALGLVYEIYQEQLVIMESFFQEED